MNQFSIRIFQEIIPTISAINKSFFVLLLFSVFTSSLPVFSQALRIPNDTNIPNTVGQKVGVTEVVIKWNAPGVKGREGKIWGTEVAYFGNKVLGFGSDMPSPWRAGADECTTFSVNTDVEINGKLLNAGHYALFMELYADSTVIIFNRNANAWGSYFYDKTSDVLRVSTVQQKDKFPSTELLNYTLTKINDSSIEVALHWEYWKIPFVIEVDLTSTILAFIKEEMRGELAFDPPSLQAAANWCLSKGVNTDQALSWIEAATNPFLGGVQSFTALSIQSQLLRNKGYFIKADSVFNVALDKATAIELHQYGRKLLSENKVEEAFKVFQQNFVKHKGLWPTHVGMMRGYSARGNFKKALEHAREALLQSPDDINRVSIENAIKLLEQNKQI